MTSVPLLQQHYLNISLFKQVRGKQNITLFLKRQLHVVFPSPRDRERSSTLIRRADLVLAQMNNKTVFSRAVIYYDKGLEITTRFIRFSSPSSRYKTRSIKLQMNVESIFCGAK